MMPSGNPTRVHTAAAKGMPPVHGKRGNRGADWGINTKRH
jgi:hypothetical protein